MGKALATVFGGSGSKNKSQQTSQSNSVSHNESYNQAYPWLQETYSPAVQSGLHAQDFISALLGLNGNPAANDAFDQYKDSSGYDFIMDSGTKAIDNNAASHGMFNSGATAKELTKFGQGTASQFYNNYLDRLLGLSNQGLQAGGLISSAGGRSFGDNSSSSSSQGTSKGSSYEKPGIAGFLGKAMAGAAGG